MFRRAYVRDMHSSQPARQHGLLVATAFGLFLSATAVWLLGQAVDPSAMWRVVVAAQPAYLGLAVLSLGVSMVLRTARWRSVLPVVRGSSPKPAQLLPFVILGYAANAITPLRLGDAARGVLSARRFAIGIPEMLGSVGLERLIDALALALLLFVASVGTTLPMWFGQAITLIVVASLVVLVCIHVLVRAPDLARHARLVLIKRLWRGARVEPGRVVHSLGWSVLAWCADGVTFWLCGQALSLDVGLGHALLIAGGAALGSVLPSAPAAIGTFELAGTAVAIALGLTANEGLALVLLGHAVTVVPIVVAGLLVAGAMGLNVRDLRSVSQIRDKSTASLSATEGVS